MYVSVVVTVSREECVDMVVDQLREIAAGPYQAEVILAIDNRRIKRMQLLADVEAMGFRNVQVYVTEPPSRPANSVVSRRKRIAMIRNATKELIGGSQFVFSFEDDTIIPERAVESLMKAYEESAEQVGVVSGVQIARWGRQYCGLWNIDQLDGPERYESVALKQSGVEAVDTTGFYCYLTPTQFYKDVEYGWQAPLGPDVDYGLKLRRRGMTNLVDWSVVCGHLSGDRVLWPDKDTKQLAFVKDGHRWKHEFPDEKG